MKQHMQTRHIQKQKKQRNNSDILFRKSFIRGLCQHLRRYEVPFGACKRATRSMAEASSACHAAAWRELGSVGSSEP